MDRGDIGWSDMRLSAGRRRRSVALAALTVALPVVGACSSGEASTCDKSVSVSGYIVDLSQGLDNRAESEYSQFRLDSMDVHDVLAHVAGSADGVDDQTRAAAMIVRDAVGDLEVALDDVTWDLSRASLDPTIIERWQRLITPAMLANANVVEAWIISTCGLPTMATSSGDGPDRLPDPSIPGPTATDPPTSPVDERSEQEALGTVVANLFSLTVSPSQARCLGRELSGVVDTGGAGDDPSRYNAQFQRAFDVCGIDFTVPT